MAEPAAETVLTSRRAVLLDGRPARGRLRLSDRSLCFDAQDGTRIEVLLADVERVVVARRALVVATPTAVLKLRCFGLEGVAGLLLQTGNRIGAVFD